LRWLLSLTLFCVFWIEQTTVSWAASNNTTGTVVGSTVGNAVGNTAALTNADLGTTSPLKSLVGLVLSLILIVILAIITIKFLGRRTQVRQVGSVQVLAVRQLAPNRFVEVVEIAGKKYLLGVGDGVNLLADVTDDFPDGMEEPVDAGGFSNAFASALETVRRRYGRDKNGGGRQL